MTHDESKGLSLETTWVLDGVPLHGVTDPGYDLLSSPNCSEQMGQLHPHVLCPPSSLSPWSSPACSEGSVYQSTWELPWGHLCHLPTSSTKYPIRFAKCALKELEEMRQWINLSIRRSSTSSALLILSFTSTIMFQVSQNSFERELISV